MTPASFRRLCNNLKVPLLFIHNDCLVNIHMFRIGMWASCRFGQPNFYVPGCAKIRKGRMKEADSTSVPLEYIQENLPMLVEEVNKVRIMDGVELEQRTLDESRDAARRMLNLLNPRT